MKCLLCQQEIPDESKFCNFCGHKFNLCPECGWADFTDEAMFCAACGTEFQRKEKGGNANKGTSQNQVSKNKQWHKPVIVLCIIVITILAGIIISMANSKALETDSTITTTTSNSSVNNSGNALDNSTISSQSETQKKETSNTVMQQEPVGSGNNENQVPEGYIRIPGGTFMMGSNENDGERRLHKVAVNGFYMSKTEVTNRDYEECVSSGICTPAHYDDGTAEVLFSNGWEKGIVPQQFREADKPVVAVDWNQAKTYCEWKGGHLPTEAEWEYACRAGSTTEYYWGDGGERGDGIKNEIASDYCWYSQNSRSETHIVAQKIPNAYGLYDMIGNIDEWCSDWYDSNYYSYCPSQNPQGPSTGENHVIRGSSWWDNDNYYYLRSDVRSQSGPDHNSTYIGFRCVLSQKDF